MSAPLTTDGGHTLRVGLASLLIGGYIGATVMQYIDHSQAVSHGAAHWRVYESDPTVVRMFTWGPTPAPAAPTPVYSHP